MVAVLVQRGEGPGGVGGIGAAVRSGLIDCAPQVTFFFGPVFFFAAFVDGAAESADRALNGDDLGLDEGGE